MHNSLPQNLVETSLVFKVLIILISPRANSNLLASTGKDESFNEKVIWFGLDYLIYPSVNG